MEIINFPKKSISPPDTVLVDASAVYRLCGDDLNAVVNVVVALQSAITDVILALTPEVVERHPDRLLDALTDMFREAIEENLDPEDIWRAPPNFSFDAEPPRAS
jgi:acetyl-CoA acetyltransferase